MAQESAFGVVSKLSAASLGVFRGRAAEQLGVTRKQLAGLVKGGAVVREHPDTYRMTAVRRSNEQRTRAALLWAGDDSAAAGRSAGELFDLQGVLASRPEIVVPRSNRSRCAEIVVHSSDDRAALMLRRIRGLRVTGIEATLTALAHCLDAERLEIACEDARRRRLTSVPALKSYLDRFGRPGRRGSAGLRRLVGELDPQQPSRSTLEVKTRRLLVASGYSDFRREFPLTWKGRVHFFDFAFESQRVILETNGRRWHDDAADYEHDNEKWSVPGRLGYRLILATWTKVARDPTGFLDEVATSLTAA